MQSGVVRRLHRSVRRQAAARRRRRVNVLGDGSASGSTAGRHRWAGLAVNALPGLAAVIAVIFTWFSVGQATEELRISQEGQITARYNAAVTNLGSGSADVRVGGIYALERIMRDSPRDNATGLSVLAAYVRAHARLPAGGLQRPAPTVAAPPAEPLAVDLQAAVTVLANRPVSEEDRTILQLRYVRLRGLADMGDLDLAREVRAPGLPDARRQGSAPSGVRANLTGVDLTGSDLREAQLYKATFSRALLPGADLRGAYLAETVFVGAVLTGAVLQDANFRGADLSAPSFGRRDGLQRADLRRADLSDAKLAGTNLRHANLSKAIAENTDFSGADLSGADLRGAYLKNADLRGANLVGAQLHGANLTGAKLEGARMEPEPEPEFTVEGRRTP
ncbi:pentapeptide repeat-containing protein [Streptomyces sp. R44]|uniref:Pentapeptide repeat-containing protein n=1 Tax=Streptomyces sp. R44 TaxID=3238633 RepID=A0AB39T9G7_9ACTN